MSELFNFCFTKASLMILSFNFKQISCLLEKKMVSNYPEADSVDQVGRKEDDDCYVSMLYVKFILIW